jgi:hypothetical protein
MPVAKPAFGENVADSLGEPPVVLLLSPGSAQVCVPLCRFRFIVTKDRLNGHQFSSLVQQRGCQGVAHDVWGDLLRQPATTRHILYYTPHVPGRHSPYRRGGDEKRRFVITPGGQVTAQPKSTPGAKVYLSLFLAFADHKNALAVPLDSIAIHSLRFANESAFGSALGALGSFNLRAGFLGISSSSNNHRKNPRRIRTTCPRDWALRLLKLATKSRRFCRLTSAIGRGPTHAPKRFN